QPTSVAPTPPPPPPPPKEKLDPLAAADEKTLSDALAKTKTIFKVAAKERSDKLLVVSLDDPGLVSGTTTDAAIESDAVALFRAIYGAMPSAWTDVRLVFRSLWQSKFGEQQQIPVVLVSLDPSSFGKIHFENLRPEEVFSLFRTERPPPPEDWTKARVVPKPT